jgi:hypothetical protein
MRPIDRSRNAVRELSRYAPALTFATAVTAANFAGGVIVSPFLGQRTIIGLVKRCVAQLTLSRAAVAAPLTQIDCEMPAFSAEGKAFNDALRRTT